MVTKECGCRGKVTSKSRKGRFTRISRSKQQTIKNINIKRNGVKSMVTSDKEKVLVKYISKLKGNHSVRGGVTEEPYGHIKNGDVVYIKPQDIGINRRGVFEVVKIEKVIPEPEPTPLIAPTPVNTNIPQPTTLLENTQTHVIPQVVETPVVEEYERTTWEEELKATTPTTEDSTTLVDDDHKANVEVNIEAIPNMGRFKQAINLAGFITKKDFLQDKEHTTKELVRIQGISEKRVKTLLDFVESV